jgi:hypothetical protein
VGYTVGRADSQLAPPAVAVTKEARNYRPHKVKFVYGTKRWTAECWCGWQSKPRYLKRDAKREAIHHDATMVLEERYGIFDDM